jgi:hypothetical protein
MHSSSPSKCPKRQGNQSEKPFLKSMYTYIAIKATTFVSNISRYGVYSTWPRRKINCDWAMLSAVITCPLNSGFARNKYRGGWDKPMQNLKERISKVRLHTNAELLVMGTVRDGSLFYRHSVRKRETLFCSIWIDWVQMLRTRNRVSFQSLLAGVLSLLCEKCL